VKVRTEGPLVFNNVYRILDAAVAGLGLGYMPRDLAQAVIDTGALVPVLEDWCSSLPGYHLYYLTRHQPSPAFVLLVKALRYRVS
jgi:DNA-binding transcriptional LysR family regulator